MLWNTFNIFIKPKKSQLSSGGSCFVISSGFSSLQVFFGQIFGLYFEEFTFAFLIFCFKSSIDDALLKILFRQ